MMRKDKRMEKFINYRNKVYAVFGEVKSFKDFTIDKGYINDDNYIYIYSDKILTNFPTFYKKDGELIFNKLSDDLMENFTIDKLYDLSMEAINNGTDGTGVLYDDNLINDMNSSTKLFVPIINENDDPLKKIIKTVIIEKGIDIARLKHRMTKNYGLTNLKTPLIKPTKMSIVNFMLWCELLGINFEIIIKDNGSDTINPLPKDLSFDSTNAEIKEV